MATEVVTLKHAVYSTLCSALPDDDFDEHPRKDELIESVMNICREFADSEVGRLLALMTDDKAAQYVIDSGNGSQFSWEMKHHCDHAKGTTRISLLKHLQFIKES